MSDLADLYHENRELRRKLAEAQTLVEATSRDCNAIALERNKLRGQLAEARRVPPDCFGDSRYAIGWNDCLAWIRQVRNDAAVERAIQEAGS